MRCDRAVTLLATGGVLGRWRARRHAAHCPRCAAEAVRLERIARELSAAEPLSAARRALWSSAAEPRPVARPARSRPALLAGAAASVVLVIGAAIVARWFAPRPDEPPNLCSAPVITVPDRRRPPDEAIPALDDLKAHLEALSQDLTRLRRQAELLDERRDAEALSRRFEQPLALNGP